MAGGQSGELPGRPGLNPLRFATRYHVDENHYEMVKELAKITKINAARENSIQNGYSSPFEPGIIPLGKSVFVLMIITGPTVFLMRLIQSVLPMRLRKPGNRPI